MVSQVLGLDAGDHTLGIGHQTIELIVRADVELLETLEERQQVRDRRIAENLARPIVAQPLGQMTNELTELIRKRLFRQLHGFIETRLHTGAFAVVKLRADSQQILGRIARRILPLDREQLTEVCFVGNRSRAGLRI